MIQIWGVDGNQLSIVPSEGHIKLFSGNCYIVKYKYPGSQRDESILYAWLGLESIEVRVLRVVYMFSSIFRPLYWTISICFSSLGLPLVGRETFLIFHDKMFSKR